MRSTKMRAGHPTSREEHHVATPSPAKIEIFELSRTLREVVLTVKWVECGHCATLSHPVGCDCRWHIQGYASSRDFIA